MKWHEKITPAVKKVLQRIAAVVAAAVLIAVFYLGHRNKCQNRENNCIREQSIV